MQKNSLNLVKFIIVNFKMDDYGKELPFNIIPSDDLFEAVTAFTENQKNPGSRENDPDLYPWEKLEYR